MPSSLRLIQTVGATRCSWNALVGGYSRPLRHHRHQLPSLPAQVRRMASETTNRKKDNQFLIPGFQPTAITGDNIGFYHGSTFMESPPGTLPILNLSVILSPGQYCKKSSWLTSHHRHKGTKSGVDAAQRLVEARRELMEVARNELKSHESSICGDNMENYESTRKIYSITGHGVPTGLLCQLVDVARGWLLYDPSSTAHNQDIGSSEKSLSTSLPQAASSSMKIIFANTTNSTLLDQNQIRIINSHGSTASLASLPKEWEHDFEMFMVVMDRMGSRMASLAIPPSGNNDYEQVDSTGTGSIITPSQIKQWGVTIMKGEALPMSLLPHNPLVGSNQGGGKRGRHGEGIAAAPNLTLEWVKRTKDCWNVILRLQEDGTNAENMHGGRRDPISLVFEGKYVAS